MLIHAFVNFVKNVTEKNALNGDDDEIVFMF